MSERSLPQDPEEGKRQECLGHARSVVEALCVGMPEYRNHCKATHLENPNSFPSMLLRVWEEKLARREEMELAIAVGFGSARTIDEYPNKLKTFLNDFISHDSLDLPARVAKSCGISPSWFNQWARDHHLGTGLDTRAEGMQRSGFLVVIEDYLSSCGDINDIIALFTKGLMHFFKTAVKAKLSTLTLAEGEDAPPAPLPRQAPYGVPFPDEDLLSRMAAEAANRTTPRTKLAFLTSALIDMGVTPLPMAIEDSLRRSPKALEILKKHYDLRIHQEGEEFDPRHLPSDGRVRLKAALAALGDLLELTQPVRVHDKYYQRHKQIVRAMRGVCQAHERELQR